jgi:hypothetical protein
MHVVNERAKENLFDLNGNAVKEFQTDLSHLTVRAGETVALMGVVRPWQLDPEDFHRLPDNTYEILNRVESIHYTFTDGETDYPAEIAAKFNCENPEKYFAFSPYTYEITHYDHCTARVELNDSPRVASGESRRVKVTITARPTLRESHKLQLRLILPEGWTVGHYARTLLLEYPQPIHGLYGDAPVEFEITAGDVVEPINRAYLEVVTPNICYPMMIPIVFLG